MTTRTPRDILDALLAEAHVMGREIDLAHRAFEADSTPHTLGRWEEALAKQRGMSRAIRVVTALIANTPT